MSMYRAILVQHVSFARRARAVASCTSTQHQLQHFRLTTFLFQLDPPARYLSTPAHNIMQVNDLS